VTGHRALRVGLTVAVLALPAGCGADRPPSTELTLTATNSFVGVATFRLTCGPPGGDIPRPAAACAALAGSPDTLLRPEPFVCIGGTSSWWDIRITGRLAGAPVQVKTSTCWTPQMKLIRALGIAHALPRHVDPLSRPAFPGVGIPG
jgi:hypothetical protein